MLWRSIISSRFNMKATPMVQVKTQNLDTGEIVRTWVKSDQEFVCIARGITSRTATSSGSLEQFRSSGVVISTDDVIIQYPADVVLSKRSRITDIKASSGEVLWTEEESDNTPTIFEVVGVIPIPDPFGHHIENHAILQRAEVQ